MAQHWREAVQLLDAGRHFLTDIFGQRGGGDASEPGALPAPSPPTSSSTTCPYTSSSSTSGAAGAPRSHHPPSFLASLHHAKGRTARLLPSSSRRLLLDSLRPRASSSCSLTFHLRAFAVADFPSSSCFSLTAVRQSGGVYVTAPWEPSCVRAELFCVTARVKSRSQGSEAAGSFPQERYRVQRL